MSLNEKILMALILPFLLGAVLSAAFARFGARWLSWPQQAISVISISMMSGVLGYVFGAIVLLIAYPKPRIGSDILIGLFWAITLTAPIVFIVGPLFISYMITIRAGKKPLGSLVIVLTSISAVILNLIFLALFLPRDTRQKLAEHHASQSATHHHKSANTKIGAQ